MDKIPSQEGRSHEAKIASSPEAWKVCEDLVINKLLEVVSDLDDARDTLKLKANIADTFRTRVRKIKGAFKNINGESGVGLLSELVIDARNTANYAETEIKDARIVDLDNEEVKQFSQILAAQLINSLKITLKQDPQFAHLSVGLLAWRSLRIAFENHIQENLTDLLPALTQGIALSGQLISEKLQFNSALLEWRRDELEKANRSSWFKPPQRDYPLLVSGTAAPLSKNDLLTTWLNNALEGFSVNSELTTLGKQLAEVYNTRKKSERARDIALESLEKARHILEILSPISPDTAASVFAGKHVTPGGILKQLGYEEGDIEFMTKATQLIELTSKLDEQFVLSTSFSEGPYAWGPEGKDTNQVKGVILAMSRLSHQLFDVQDSTERIVILRELEKNIEAWISILEIEKVTLTTQTESGLERGKTEPSQGALRQMDEVVARLLESIKPFHNDTLRAHIEELKKALPFSMQSDGAQLYLDLHLKTARYMQMNGKKFENNYVALGEYKRIFLALLIDFIDAYVKKDLKGSTDNDLKKMMRDFLKTDTSTQKDSPDTMQLLLKAFGPDRTDILIADSLRILPHCEQELQEAKRALQVTQSMLPRSEKSTQIPSEIEPDLLKQLMKTIESLPDSDPRIVALKSLFPEVFSPSPS